MVHHQPLNFTELLCDSSPGSGIPESRVSGGCQAYGPIHRVWWKHGIVELACGHFVPSTNPRRQVPVPAVRQEAA